MWSSLFKNNSPDGHQMESAHINLLNISAQCWIVNLVIFAVCLKLDLLSITDAAASNITAYQISFSSSFLISHAKG